MVEALILGTQWCINSIAYLWRRCSLGSCGLELPFRSNCPRPIFSLWDRMTLICNGPLPLYYESLYDSFRPDEGWLQKSGSGLAASESIADLLTVSL